MIFEMTTGSPKLVTKKASKAQLKISGYAAEYKDDVFAVYVNNNQVFFKANSQEWDLTAPGAALHYRRILFFEFIKIIIQGKIVFSRWYNVFGTFRETVKDPTFDKIDEDSKYFLQWCSRILNNPEKRENICLKWGQ